MTNHPYLKKLQSTLNKHYELHDALLKRNILIREGFSSKSEFEQNEIEITIIKTSNELETLRKVITAREEYFKKYIQEFAVKFEDCEKNFDATLSEAKNRAGKIKFMPELLNQVDFDAVEKNIEVKINLHERLKKMLNK